MKKWYPVLLVLLFVAGGVALLFILPDTPRVDGPKPLPRARPTSDPTATPPAADEDAIDQLPPLLDDDADREIEKNFPDPLELPDPIDIPEEHDHE